MYFTRLFMGVALVLFASVTYSPSVHAGWFDIFFPSGPKGPIPAETLRAPFADDDAVIEEMDASGNSSNQTPLHLRHRTNETITLWAQNIIPEMISYKTKGYERQYGKKVINFDKPASEEYVRFLNDRNFITTLKTGRYDIAGFVTDYPVLLNEGAKDGHYRWLYQMNIMVTYVDSGINNYNNIKKGSSISQEFVLTFQIGRSRDASNDIGLLIESWDVKSKQKR